MGNTYKKFICECGKEFDNSGSYGAHVRFCEVHKQHKANLKKMEDKVLVELAHELTDLIRRSRTVDWDKKESARAYMRTQVKHLLRRHKYPPEDVKEAINIVIQQAELMSANMVV